MSIYLEDIDFSQREDEYSCGAHIAYTFDFQGGAASGYNTPLMFKSKGKPTITFEKIEMFKSLGENMDKIEKDFIQQLLANLNESVNDKFNSSGWDWIQVVDADFDNNLAIFCCDEGMFSVGFQREDLVFTIDDVAEPVVQVSSYQVVDGELYLSPDFMENLVDQALASKLKSTIKSSEVKALLIKAATDKKTKEEPSIKKSSKTKKGDPALDIKDAPQTGDIQELIKAQVAAQLDAVRKEAQEEANAVAKAAIEKAEAEVAALRKAQIERNIADTELVVKGYAFIAEEDVDAVVKHLVDNPEAAEVLLKTLDAAKQEITNVRKNLGEEKGVSVETAPEKATVDQNSAIAKRAAERKAQLAAK